MSSTNRGSRRDPRDYYITPVWCTEALLGRLDELGTLPDKGKVLDPGCGAGEIFEVLLDWCPSLAVTGVEIDKDRARKASGKGARILRTDFLKSKLVEKAGPFDLAIANPPFILAFEFWQRAMTLVKRGGRVIFFGRVGLIESKVRRLMWENSGWEYQYVLPRRASCRPDGGTDSTTYSWFQWRKGYRGTATVERLFIPDYDVEIAT